VSDAEMLVECVGAGRHYANELALGRARDRAAAHGPARRRAIDFSRRSAQLPRRASHCRRISAVM
jgi:hypothetical protein